jgi:hypothetical protein
MLGWREQAVGGRLGATSAILMNQVRASDQLSGADLGGVEVDAGDPAEHVEDREGVPVGAAAVGSRLMGIPAPARRVIVVIGERASDVRAAVRADAERAQDLGFVAANGGLDLAGADEALAGHLGAPSIPEFMRAAIATIVAFIRLIRGSG